MLSIILWVITIILILVGAFLGFRRGVIKESIRIGIWAVLFVITCFLILGMADRAICLVATALGVSAGDAELLVSELLLRVDILQSETYLISPVAGALCSVVVPFLAIVGYWVSGLISLIIYAVVMKLWKAKKADTLKNNLVISLFGLVLGMLLGLFGGALTVFPMQQISNVAQEYEELNVIPETGSVQLLYRYTGTEWLADKAHDGIVHMVVPEEGCNVWNQLPQLMDFGMQVWQLYPMLESGVQEAFDLTILEEIREKYLALEILPEEEEIRLLNHLESQLMEQVMAEVIEPEELEETLSEVEQYLAETEDLTEKEKQEITEMISAVREGEVIDPIKYKELMQYAEEYLGEQE